MSEHQPNCAREVMRHADDSAAYLSEPCTCAPSSAAASGVTLDWPTFSRVNRERCESPSGFNHPLHSWSLSDWFTAILGELGEAANIAKKLNRVRDGIPGNKETPDALREKLARELADTFIYLDLLAQAANVNLPAVVVDVFNAKSAEIGSPITFVPALRYASSLPAERWQFTREEKKDE